jgi:hypothetical protein
MQNAMLSTKDEINAEAMAEIIAFTAKMKRVLPTTLVESK